MGATSKSKPQEIVKNMRYGLRGEKAPLSFSDIRRGVANGMVDFEQEVPVL
jgi:hypothetical protein